jgi:hypothetical protein
MQRVSSASVRLGRVLGLGVVGVLFGAGCTLDALGLSDSEPSTSDTSVASGSAGGEGGAAQGGGAEPGVGGGSGGSSTSDATTSASSTAAASTSATSTGSGAAVCPGGRHAAFDGDDSLEYSPAGQFDADTDFAWLLRVRPGDAGTVLQRSSPGFAYRVDWDGADTLSLVVGMGMAKVTLPTGVEAGVWTNLVVFRQGTQLGLGTSTDGSLSGLVYAETSFGGSSDANSPVSFATNGFSGDLDEIFYSASVPASGTVIDLSQLDLRLALDFEGPEEPPIASSVGPSTLVGTESGDPEYPCY